MNKANLERQAKGRRPMASLVPGGKSAAGKPAAGKAARPAAQSGDRLTAFLYAALLAGSDFLRTQMSEADVCRNALRRAEIAAKVWRAAKEEA